MKIAIIHDYLNQYGGAERVVEVLHEIFPQAPLYTSVYLPDTLPESFRKMDIRTSFMQRLPNISSHYKKYFLIYPFAFKSMNLSGYDCVLSSSSAYAKGVKLAKGIMHICYCYTPARFIWRHGQYMENEDLGGLSKKAIRMLTFLLKDWDLQTAKRVDRFLASCENIRHRISDTYRRESHVIYPPIDTARFYIADKVDNYFLVVSRLNAYKRIDLAVKALGRLKLPLKIIGEGPFRKNLEAGATDNIQFLGRVDEKTLVDHYARCRALIFPGEEDFGLAPIEAQASGRPVIAYAAGGALETVAEPVNGIFFRQPNEGSLIEAIEKFIRMEKDFRPQKIREGALHFDKKIFKGQILDYVNREYADFKSGLGNLA